MYERIFDFLPGAATGTALLLLAHIVFWPRRPQLPRPNSNRELTRPQAYVLGTSCVLAGMVITGVKLDDAWPLLFYAAHLLPGGAAVIIAWWLRGREAAREAALADAASIAEAAKREHTY